MNQEPDDRNEQHKERMARLKEAHDARLAGATREKGLIVVNTGAGKGKSSAAFGLVARSLGHGMPRRNRPVHQGSDCHRRGGVLRKTEPAGHNEDAGRGFHMGYSGSPT